jgi:hypothetical protein
LLLCSSYLPLGVPNWTVTYIIDTVPHQSLPEKGEAFEGTNTRRRFFCCAHKNVSYMSIYLMFSIFLVNYLFIYADDKSDQLEIDAN